VKADITSHRAKDVRHGRGERIDYEVWTGGMKVDLTYDVNKDLRGSKPPTREKPAATDI
jgi:hypothetical protein